MRIYLEGVGMLSKNPLNESTYVIERDTVSISKFLNRLLGLPVHAQNSLFDYFNSLVEHLIKQAKFDGTYDMGIMGMFLL